MKSASNNVSLQNQITSNPPRGKETAGFQTQHPPSPIAHKGYMNTQLEGEKKVVSTFFFFFFLLVEDIQCNSFKLFPGTLFRTH